MTTQRVRKVLAGLAAAASIGLTLGPASAQDLGPAPIAVSGCNGGIASIELVEIAAYDVTFRNTSGVTADDVRLAIPYGRRKTATFDVRGDFAPGVEIQKALRKSVGMGLFSYESSQNNCNVTFVHFTDGTSWTPPAPAH